MNVFSPFPFAHSPCATFKFRQNVHSSAVFFFAAVYNDHRCLEQWGKHIGIGDTPNNRLMSDEACNYYSTPYTALHNMTQLTEKLEVTTPVF